MSRYLEYVFPAGVVNDVCLLQNTAGAGNLILNGNLANAATGQVNFISNGYCRSVSISSMNDLSGVDFTINGIQNGVFLSRVVAGPVNETIYFEDPYDIITSISVDGAVNGVQIGTSYVGFFKIISINLERDFINYSLSIGTVLAPNIPPTSLSLLGTISKDISNSTYRELIIDSSFFLIHEENVENQYFVNSTTPYYYLIVELVGTEEGIANITQLNFIQT